MRFLCDLKGFLAFPVASQKRTLCPASATVMATRSLRSSFPRSPSLDFHAFGHGIQAQFGGPRGLAQQWVRIIQTAVQLTFQRFYSERPDSIRAARPEPRIVTGDECGHRLFLADRKSVV